MSRSSVNCSRALTYIEASQRCPCTSQVGLLFVTMGAAGLANDINHLARMTHFTLMHTRATKRPWQVVILPPKRLSNGAASSIELSVERPWHWLEGHPLAEVFQLSTCHEQLLKQNISWLSSLARHVPTSELRHQSPHPLVTLQIGWQDSGSLPKWLEPAGRRWWWSVLTSYVLRVRGRLEAKLERRLAHAHDLSPTDEYRWASFVRSHPFRHYPCEARPMLFSLGLHHREGDACGVNAKAQPARLCERTARAVLALLSNLTSNDVMNATSRKLVRVFLSTDSDAMARRVLRLRGISAHALTINRSKYETRELTEVASELAPGRMEEVLLEGMLDLLLLAHSDRIAGALLGNFARVAMQWRVREDEKYISLDGRRWCGASRCMDEIESARTPDGDAVQVQII